MRKATFKIRSGMTLVEVIIFSVLLSLLLSSSVAYIWAILHDTQKLDDDVYDSYQKGFVATTAVIILSIGTLVILVASVAGVAAYADMVDTRELRMQKELNQEACADTTSIIRAKNIHADGRVYLMDFGCIISLGERSP